MAANGAKFSFRTPINLRARKPLRPEHPLLRSTVDFRQNLVERSAIGVTTQLRFQLTIEAVALCGELYGGRLRSSARKKLKR